MWSVKYSVCVGTLCRLLLVFYGRIHDYLFSVNFTDIDYDVFTDAASHICNGESPFLAKTYRYSPMLAICLVPSCYLHEFGKILFALCDILNACLIYAITRKSLKWHEDSARFACYLWLFNPFTAIISCRGNAESLVVLSVLLTLYLVLNNYLFLAAIIHGAFAIHIKLYPIIYIPSIFIFIIRPRKFKSLWDFVTSCLCNIRGIVYIIVCMTSFIGSVYGFYVVYGMQYINQGLLYHFGRFDPKHNFSVYFYVFYLCSKLCKDWISIISLCAFIPQVLCILIFALKYAQRDLPFCWLLTTFAFVAFNKVSTSQYFVWYICLIPFLNQGILQQIKTFKLVSLWLTAQGSWLLMAYLFEFQGKDVLIYVWMCSIMFLLVNCYIIVSLMKAFANVESSSVKKHK